MSIGIFSDKTQQPSDIKITEVIGLMIPLWSNLIQFIRTNFKVKEEFKYMYGKNYGWALRFQINNKLFTALYPAKNGFSVQIILNSEAIEKAFQMKLSKNIQTAIDTAYPYPEGKWLFIKVESANDIQEIKQILIIKSEKLVYSKKGK
jgi:hypothetical protein